MSRPDAASLQLTALPASELGSKTPSRRTYRRWRVTALRPFQLFLQFLGFPHRPQCHPSCNDRPEDYVDVERVEAPPDQRGREGVRRDHVAKGGAERELHGAAAAGGGDDGCAIQEAEWPERERLDSNLLIDCRQNESGQYAQAHGDVDHRREKGSHGPADVDVAYRFDRCAHLGQPFADHPPASGTETDALRPAWRREGDVA